MIAAAGGASSTGSFVDWQPRPMLNTRGAIQRIPLTIRSRKSANIRVAERTPAASDEAAPHRTQSAGPGALAGALPGSAPLDWPSIAFVIRAREQLLLWAIGV